MTVSISERLSPLYEGNGINTRFDFTFRVFDQEDANGVSVKHQVGADFENIDESLYSVTINPDNLGGYITFLTAPEVGFEFYIAGETPVDQQLDITNYDNFYPDAIERSLDKLTAILQEWSHSLGFEKLSREKALEILDLALQEQIRDQGLALDQIDAFAQDLANRLKNIVVERGWLAELIVDGDQTQKELNSFFKLIEASPELFGYKSGDATQYFKNASAYAKAFNLPLVAKNPNGYLITDSLDFYTPTGISKVILPADGVSRYLTVKTAKAPDTIPFASLSGLNLFSTKVTGFPLSAVGKYIRITSTDVLTERNNPDNKPYYKNTVFRLLDATGAISPTLDMGFNASSTAKVEVIPVETRIDFRIGEITTTGTGKNHNSIKIERDSVDVYISNVSGSSGFRTLVDLRGNDCNFYSPLIKDAQYTGLGYGILIGLCCDTNIYSMKASNCTTTLDGRHGSNVTVHNSRLETAGTHWGNNYLFKDCDIDIVTWSGKDLKLEGGSLRNYVSMRVDVAMCLGNCEINGTKVYSNTYVITPSSNIIANFFSTPRRVFDKVVVRNIECTENLSAIYGYSTQDVYAADYLPPKKFHFENIDAKKSDVLRLAALNLNNSVAFTETAEIRAQNIQAKVVVPLFARGFLKYASSYGYNVKAIGCGKTFIQCDANVFSRYKLIDSTFVGATRINATTALGDIIFHDCAIEHDPAIATAGLFYIESRKGFSSVEYRGAFANDGSVNGTTMYSSGRALLGATGYPKPLAGYVNRTIYQRDETAIVFDPPLIQPGQTNQQIFDFPGAQLGDPIVASFSLYNASIAIRAFVSATNKVTVSITNTGSTDVDLLQGNLIIKML
ncbi:hypothetical protein OHX04_11700 [Acinetobacter baumannii]|nr:hypothetical protein [Acinetobacter baumannii]